MKRIKTLFESLDRPALVTFITACDPSPDRSVSILKALPEAGADIIELGIPFTDPMADGPVIQMASSRALNAGASMDHVLDMVREFRQDNDTTPIVLMGYSNPVFIYGMERFAHDAAEAGVDGLILVDLPPEESDEFTRYADKTGLDLIRLITPTTDTERLKVIVNGAGGFLYYVSITGVTGAAKPDPDKIRPHIDMIKGQTDLPIAIGFGIKTPEDAVALGSLANGVVVGSSIVQTIADNADAPDLVEKVVQQVRALSGALNNGST